MDTSSHGFSDLDDFEFFWENPQLEVDADFRPGIDSLFSPTAVDSFEIHHRRNHFTKFTD